MCYLATWEGHGYALGYTEDEGVAWEAYTVNDAVAAAIEWNFQLAEETADE